jgi:hypothetical protein
VPGRFSYGDRVRVLESFYWAQGERGTITEAPPFVKELAGDWHDLHREAEHEGGAPSYWVCFDNPRFDADGDGPYESAEISGEFLALLRPTWLNWLWPAAALAFLPALVVAFLADLGADAIWGNADLNVVVFVVTFLVAVLVVVRFRLPRLWAEWFVTWASRLYSLSAAALAFLVALGTDLIWSNGRVNLLVFIAAYLVAAFAITRIRARRRSH